MWPMAMSKDRLRIAEWFDSSKSEYSMNTEFRLKFHRKNKSIPICNMFSNTLCLKPCFGSVFPLNLYEVKFTVHNGQYTI